MNRKHLIEKMQFAQLRTRLADQIAHFHPGLRKDATEQPVRVGWEYYDMEADHEPRAQNVPFPRLITDSGAWTTQPANDDAAEPYGVRQ